MEPISELSTDSHRVHQYDSDCTLDGNDMCTVCGVWHGDPCPACGQRGYHMATCSELESEETICLCGAPMVDGWCSVEGCACSATHTAIGDDGPAHAVMTRELFDLIVGGDE